MAIQRCILKRKQKTNKQNIYTYTPINIIHIHTYAYFFGENCTLENMLFNYDSLVGKYYFKLYYKCF